MKQTLKNRAVRFIAFLKQFKAFVLYLQNMPVPDFNNKYDGMML
jgi:hypothetical protein